MQSPQISQKEAVSDEVVSEEMAEILLDFLNTYQYGTLTHALFELMWHVGCRISGAIALDLDDYNPGIDDNVLHFRDRPEWGTALKNGTTSERNVTLNDSVTTILNDFIAVHREESKDDQGREPLFTSLTGRLKRQHAYREVTSYSRPCTLGKDCPHDREIEDCVAARQKKKAFECPSSTALHPIRRGSITHHINEGWPLEPLSVRVDVSRAVLKKHYDARSEEKARENRREYL